MAPKYYFSDILSKYSNFKKLPDDVNKQLIDFISSHKDKLGMKINIERDYVNAINVIQSCHFYGPLTILNDKGEIEMMIEFQYGVFSIMKIQKKFSDNSIFFITIKNDVCKFGGKPKK